MAKAKIINDIRKYLVDEGIYTSKDELTLILLESTYSQFIQASKEVKKEGQTIKVADSNGKIKTTTNPAFRNQMELQKELFKLIDSLYLSPKSRKSKKDEKPDEANPFMNLINEMNNIEKR